MLRVEGVPVNWWISNLARWVIVLSTVIGSALPAQQAAPNQEISKLRSRSNLLFRQGRLERSADDAQRAVELIRSENAQSLELSEALQWLGRVRLELSQFDQAKQCYKQSVKLERSLANDQPWRIAEPAARLKYINRYLQLTDTQRRQLHATSRDILLSSGRYNSGQRQIAIESVEAAIETRAAILGYKDRLCAEYEGMLGVWYSAQAETKSARDCLNEGIKSFKQLYGPQHRLIAAIQRQLAKIELDEGNPVAAESLCRDAAKMTRRILGEDDTVTRDAYANWAMALSECAVDALKRDEWEKAGRFYHDAADASEIGTPDQPWKSRDFRLKGNSYQRMATFNAEQLNQLSRAIDLLDQAQQFARQGDTASALRSTDDAGERMRPLLDDVDPLMVSLARLKRDIHLSSEKWSDAEESHKELVRLARKA